MCIYKTKYLYEESMLVKICSLFFLLSVSISSLGSFSSDLEMLQKESQDISVQKWDAAAPQNTNQDSISLSSSAILKKKVKKSEEVANTPEFKRPRKRSR